jgi:hypothetical protein
MLNQPFVDIQSCMIHFTLAEEGVLETQTREGPIGIQSRADALVSSSSISKVKSFVVYSTLWLSTTSVVGVTVTRTGS